MDGETRRARRTNTGHAEGLAVGEGKPGSRFWLFYAAAWILYLYIYASTLLVSGEAPLWPAVLVALGSVIPAATLGIFVVWWTGRLAAIAPNWPGFLLGHASVGIGYSILATLGTGLLLSFGMPLLTDFALPEQEHADTAIVFWQLFMGLLVYVIVASITHAFRSSLRLRREVDRAARAEALRAKAELQALRAQINPHFLFNTLHSTLALVRSDSAAAEEAIEQFADLLRYSTRIHAESLDRIPLTDEWKFVENYLSLEHLRLGNRLRVRATVEEGAGERLVPAFCLQPLVENAIRHGVAPRATGGTVSINASNSNGGVHLEVRDDGPGCDPRRITRNGRLGLRLVRQRLEVLYGDAATFEVETAPGRGFAVKFWIPAQAANKAELLEAG